MFPGFERRYVATNGVRLHTVMGGEGPPLLLLHGYPQTHAMWHAVAPVLARHFTVVCPDLRGYGDSSKVQGSDSHVEYSKRTMAADMIGLMSALGFDHFAVAGHDRGGRVTHRLCLDHPDAVTRAAVLDIIPTHTMFATLNRQTGLDYYHWLFLAQPAPLPEKMIGADPDFYLDWTLGAWGTGLDTYDPEALAEYRRCFEEPLTIHAMCEDYRAAATIDLDHDAADLEARITCPLLVGWGTEGLMAKRYDFVAEWSRKALDVSPAPIEAGHFLVDEAPAAVAEVLDTFFRA
jgi:haloacetate dehalogenase